MVSTLAGCKEGLKDGNGSKASFKYPCGICISNRDQCLYITEPESNSIRKVTLQGKHVLPQHFSLLLTDQMYLGDVTTFVNHSTFVSAFAASGKLLKQPCGIVMNYSENVFYVVNILYNTISRITSAGMRISPSLRLCSSFLTSL